MCAGYDSCAHVSAHVSAALNLVTSLLKVADIEEVQLLFMDTINRAISFTSSKAAEQVLF